LPVITAVFLLVGVSIYVIRPHMIFTVTMIAADVQQLCYWLWQPTI